MARLEQKIEDQLFRYYVTDSIQLVPQKKNKVKRYAEIVDEIYHPKEEKTAETIISETIKGAGLIL